MQTYCLAYHYQETKWFFIWFYVIGFFGFALPFTHELFASLIPYALLLSFIVALWFHKEPFKPKTILIFFAIYACSFAIEAAGVRTGIVFGQYEYGQSLGIKIFHTPLLIGFNWLMLVYFTGAVAESIHSKWYVKVIAASGLMVMYDVVMEQVAPLMDMWYWSDGRVPFQNYMAWFAVAVMFHVIVKLSRISLKNRIAPFIYICQILCLFALWLYRMIFG